MRRLHILPALAIFACLSLGADNRMQSPANAATTAGGEGAGAAEPTGATEEAPKEKTTIYAAPTRSPNECDPSAVRRWCSTEEQGAMELAASLRTRATSLDEREHLIAQREATLVDAEKRLISRIEELKKLREAVDVQLKSADDAKETKVDELVKMVEANKPNAISSMFAALDESLAVEILDRMNTSKAGKLLAALDPAKAARLAGKMAHPIASALGPDALAAALAAASPAPAAVAPTTPSATPAATPSATPAATPSATPSATPAATPAATAPATTPKSP